jgi:hypothetical protein
MGALLPVLSAVPRIEGPAAAAIPVVARKLRRVTFMLPLLIPQNLSKTELEE